MKTKLLFLFVLACAQTVFGVTNTVSFHLAEFTAEVITNRTVDIKPQSTPTSEPTDFIISSDTRRYTTDYTGSFTVTNMVQGYYLCSLQGRFTKTEWRILVPNTNVALNAFQLLVTTNTVLPITGNQLWVDPSGNDASGRRARPDKPFLTPRAARLAAQEGDAIIVQRGTYRGAGISNLFKPGLLTWILQDPTFDYIDLCTNVTTGSGIFDDRFAGGAVSNTVIGSVKIRYCSGTNVAWDEICNPFTVATNALGPIVVTNAVSEILWSAHADIRHWGQVPMPFALYVKNCRASSYFKNLNFVTNGAPGATFSVSNCPAAPGTPIPVDVGCNFIYWELGTFALHFGRAQGFANYAFDFYGIDANDSANIHIEGDFLDGKLYGVGYSKNWKIWADIKEWQNSTGNPNLINCYNAGSHYFRVQKGSTKLGAVIDMGQPTGTDTNLVVWVDVDKVSGSNGFVKVTHGALRGRVGHFEQNGPSDGTPGIFTTNISALVDLSGEDIYSANTAVEHGGGRTVLRNYSIYSTNRDPILVTGAGLRLQSTVLIPGLGATNSIRAAAAQTVGVYGMLLQKSNAHANITFSSGLTNVITDFDTD